MSDQLKKVLLVTGHVKECGIYQYADSLFEILMKSKTYQFIFVSISNADALNEYVNAVNPYAIIYNHHPTTMPWLNNGVTRPLKNLKSIKQIMITGHEHVHEFIGIDSYVFVDPRSKNGTIPPITYYDDIVYSKPDNVVKIGTSGFANRTKNIKKIISLINEQFDDKVILNIHLSDGAFIDPSGNMSSRMIAELRSIAKSNIEININQNFMDKNSLIRWLNQNDINLYWYESAPVPGVSASINHALAAKKPFGVNDCTLLNHVRKEYNDLEKTKIIDIVKNSPEKLNEFYAAWNQNTVLKYYEDVLDEKV
jgi:hypothetical protein